MKNFPGEHDKSLSFRIAVICLFAIAMGFLESAVVIYLRAIYYPEGFAFPLKMMPAPVAITEILREAATMIMLAAVALLSDHRWTVRFAWFIYMFAIWDIFYYVFLWFLLGWPESLLTWDILFLIPTLWVGPVLAPVINSLTMILLALVIIIYGKKHEWVKLVRFEWSLLIIGSLVTIFAYTREYSAYLLGKFSFMELLSFPVKSEVSAYAAQFIPQHFEWPAFFFGEAIFLAAIISIWRGRK